MKDNITQSPIYKALTAPYTKLPRDFNTKIGILFYNKDFDLLIDEYLKDFPKDKVPKELIKGIKQLYKKAYPHYKETIDRAIKGEEPTLKDQLILKDAFSKIWLDVKRKNNHYFPLVYPKLDNPSDVIIQWTYYVWIRRIKVRYCKAVDCNRIFIPVRSDQKYCSVNCRNRAYYQRKKQTFYTDTS